MSKKKLSNPVPYIFSDIEYENRVKWLRELRKPRKGPFWLAWAVILVAIGIIAGGLFFMWKNLMLAIP